MHHHGQVSGQTWLGLFSWWWWPNVCPFGPLHLTAAQRVGTPCKSDMINVEMPSSKSHQYNTQTQTMDIQELLEHAPTDTWPHSTQLFFTNFKHRTIHPASLSSIYSKMTLVCVSFEFVDHGGRWGNTAQAFGRWWHPVASSEALDMLYRVMCPALHHRICMTIEIASNLPAFFIVVDALLPTTIAK